MRGTSQDEKWIKVRDFVRKRDPYCRCCQILSIPEMMLFKKSNPRALTHLECAHHYPRHYLDTYYNPNNIFCLCAEHHWRIDHLMDPVTNTIITPEKREEWWKRIAGKDYKTLEEMKVELALVKED